MAPGSARSRDPVAIPPNALSSQPEGKTKMDDAT